MNNLPYVPPMPGREWGKIILLGLAGGLALGLFLCLLAGAVGAFGIAVTERPEPVYYQAQ